MKKLVLIAAMVMLLLNGILIPADASPIAWSRTSASLNTLTFYTTDTLGIQLLSNPNESVLSAETQIFLQDLTPSVFYGGWMSPYKSDYEYLNINFVATGSGFLNASIETQILYNALAWAMPSRSGGEDAIAWLSIGNITKNTRIFNMRDSGFNDHLVPMDEGVRTLYTQGGQWPSGVYFNDGDTGTISISLETYLWTQYDTYPAEPEAVPSPPPFYF